jgi:hypothetical protein
MPTAVSSNTDRSNNASAGSVMTSRARRKAAELESLTFQNQDLAAVHGVIIDNVAYTEYGAVPDDRIDEALFGESLKRMQSEFTELQKINSTSRRTNRSVVQEYSISQEISRMKRKKTYTLGRYKKLIGSNVGVPIIKFADKYGVVRHCIPLCKASFGHYVEQVENRIDHVRHAEALAEATGEIVGSVYKKIIPGDPGNN